MLAPRLPERSEWLHTRDNERLEAMWTLPEEQPRGASVVCHPHPLQGGTMANKVVTTTLRAATAAGLAGLRFNFRGVGRSSGSYGHGQDEIADLEAALDFAQREAPGKRVIAGFSFGSMVAANACSNGATCDVLILIGFPIAKWEIPLPTPPRGGIHIIVGDDDPFAPLDKLETLKQAYGPRVSLHVVRESGHFFHGRLELLAARVGLALER